MPRMLRFLLPVLASLVLATTLPAAARVEGLKVPR